MGMLKHLVRSGVADVDTLRADVASLATMPLRTPDDLVREAFGLAPAKEERRAPGKERAVLERETLLRGLTS